MGDSIIETFNLTRIFEKMPLSRGFSLLSREIKKTLGFEKPRTITAVDNVNIRIRKGEIFGLLGPNGAGKTTLIKLLCSLISPTSGTATVNGYDIVKDEVQVKKSISFVSTGGWLAFDWAFTIKQNLRLFAALKGFRDLEASRRVDEALRIVGLEDKSNEVPSVLSSGMRQRASLAAGLIATTPIFFLDEPTIGIDPITAHDIRDFIKEKLNRERGQTVFLTTHIMEEAEIMCDRVAIMNKGRIIACDRPEALKSKVQAEQVIEITALNITLDIVERMKKVELVHEVVSHLEDPVLGKAILRLHVAQAEEVLPKILHLIEMEKGEIVYARKVEPTLEDVFIKMTTKEA